MKTQSIYRNALTILGIGIIVTFASSAAQAYQTFTLQNDLSTSVNLQVEGNPNVYVGRSFGQFDNTGPIFNVFCIDYNHGINFGQSYTTDASFTVTAPGGPVVNNYYAGGYISALTPQDFNPITTGLPESQRANEIAWLIDKYTLADATTFSNGKSGTTDLNQNLAAVQLAIWNISEDGGGKLAGGNVYLDNPNENSIYSPFVSYYENLAGLNVFYKSNNAHWIQAPLDGNFNHMQDFSLDVTQVGQTPPPAVPEPSFVAFAICMAIVAGTFVARRRLAH
jgi:hypothetical protein